MCPNYSSSSIASRSFRGDNTAAVTSLRKSSSDASTQAQAHTSKPPQNQYSEPAKHRNSKRGTNLVQVSTPKIPPIAHTDFHIMPQSLRLRMTTVRTHDRIARPALLYQVIYNVLFSLASLPTLCLTAIQQVEPSPVTRKVHRSKSLDTGEAVSNRLHFGLFFISSPG
jgi:hypothetical protein